LVEYFASFKAYGTADDCVRSSRLDRVKKRWNLSNVNINTGNGQFGNDVSSILAGIYTFDPQNTSCNGPTFQLCSPNILENHKAVIDAFRTIYSIESGLGARTAAVIGAYTEDSYCELIPWLTRFRGSRH